MSSFKKYFKYFRESFQNNAILAKKIKPIYLDNLNEIQKILLSAYITSGGKEDLSSWESISYVLEKFAHAIYDSRANQTLVHNFLKHKLSNTKPSAVALYNEIKKATEGMRGSMPVDRFLLSLNEDDIYARAKDQDVASIVTGTISQLSDAPILKSYPNANLYYLSFGTEYQRITLEMTQEDILALKSLLDQI